MIKQALISVSDKTDIVNFARFLKQCGVTLISTGGSAKTLQNAGIDVIEIAEYTGLPEMLDGRVKTLHPKIYGGLLAQREKPEHMSQLNQLAIQTIDLLIVNLYPFQETISRPDCTLKEAIENIDIGGPTLLRAAAKNYADVTVLVDPKDYKKVMEEMKEEQCSTKLETRYELACKTFQHTSEYDAIISNYLKNKQTFSSSGFSFPNTLTFSLKKHQDLRYGENPHQKAAFYKDTSKNIIGGLASYNQVQGKPLSYNNLSDAEAAWTCVNDFHNTKPICTIIKHANPCGIASASNALSAYERALACDPISAFGGIIAFNCEIDKATAEKLIEQFAEVIMAKAISIDALKTFEKKPDLRILIIPPTQINNIEENFIIKRIGSGILIQTPNTLAISSEKCHAVTKRQASIEEEQDAFFAWHAVKHVKSNAIVFCRNQQTLAIGAGQMSRVDAAKLAVSKAKSAGIDLTGSVAASDAFFPFRDGLDIVAKAGAKCIIQPGGSKRDAEVIAAANDYNIAMLFTGIRHFSH